MIRSVTSRRLFIKQLWRNSAGICYSLKRHKTEGLGTHNPLVVGSSPTGPTTFNSTS